MKIQFLKGWRKHNEGAIVDTELEKIDLTTVEALLKFDYAKEHPSGQVGQDIVNPTTIKNSRPNQ